MQREVDDFNAKDYERGQKEGKSYLKIIRVNNTGNGGHWLILKNFLKNCKWSNARKWSQGLSVRKLLNKTPSGVGVKIFSHIENTFLSLHHDNR